MRRTKLLYPRRELEDKSVAIQGAEEAEVWSKRNCTALKRVVFILNQRRIFRTFDVRHLYKPVLQRVAGACAVFWGSENLAADGSTRNSLAAILGQYKPV